MRKHDSVLQRGFQFDERFRVWIDPQHRQVISRSVFDRLSAGEFSNWADAHPKGESWQFWIEMTPPEARQLIDYLADTFPESAG